MKNHFPNSQPSIGKPASKTLYYLGCISLLLMLVTGVSAVEPNTPAGTGTDPAGYNEVPEMDMTGLHTDIELIEVDPEIMNATPDWIVLAHDPAGKQSLMDDINESSLSDSEKEDMRDSVQALWDKYPTKFEAEGEKYVSLSIESNGTNQTVSLPVGHVTRISFDHDRISPASSGRTRLPAASRGSSGGISLTEAENTTISNISAFLREGTFTDISRNDHRHR
ncbi:MAG: hypothetical protein ABFC24_00425 [Methanoregulaceae archaeon]